MKSPGKNDFHVKKYLNDALDTVRKEELRKARKEKNDEFSQILHCNQRFILMKSVKSKKIQDLLGKLGALNERVYQAMLSSWPSMRPRIGKRLKSL